MSAFMAATVVFREDVTIETVVYSGAVQRLRVSMEDPWLHVQSGADEGRVHSFPLSMIACVAWDSAEAEPPFVPFGTR